MQKAITFNFRTEENDTGGNDRDEASFALNQTLSSFLQAFPNPLQDILFVKIDEQSLAENPLIVILDVTGREVWRGQMTKNSLEVDLSSLSSGTYFIRASTSVGLPVLRIVKK